MLYPFNSSSDCFVRAGAIYTIGAATGAINKVWQPENAKVNKIFANGVCLARLNKSNTKYLSYDIRSNGKLAEFDEDNGVLALVKDFGAIKVGKLPLMQIKVGQQRYHVLWDSSHRRLVGTDAESGGGNLFECRAGSLDVLRTVFVGYYLGESHVHGNPDKGPFALVYQPTIPVHYPKYARFFSMKLADIRVPNDLNLIWEVTDNTILASRTIDNEVTSNQEQGDLYCFNAATGATKWIFKDHTVSAAKMVGDVVLAATKNKLVALNKETGIKIADLALSSSPRDPFFVGDYLVVRDRNRLKGYRFSSH